MSRQPIGKTLLRNVIRHTDAHNKIQEEMDMWKMRDWETHRSRPQNLSDPTCMRHMHCDRVAGDLSRSRASEHDDRDSRYWSRKLYDFEANDPDRWGHSGFKELYPEEFESDSEKSCDIKSSGHRKLKKSKSNKEACLSKRLKKSSRKKKKKKKKVEEKQKKADCPSSDDDSSDDNGSAIKDKQRKKGSKSRHKNKKTSRSKERDVDTSDEDVNKAKMDKRTNSLKKRKHKASESALNSKKRRKNWKAVGVQSSDDSSTN